MNITINNAVLEIWMKDSSKPIYAITAKRPSLAKELNAILGRFPEDTIFKKGEEPTFYLSSALLQRVRFEVPYLTKLLAQIDFRSSWSR